MREILPSFFICIKQPLSKSNKTLQFLHFYLIFIFVLFVFSCQRTLNYSIDKVFLKNTNFFIKKQQFIRFVKI